MREFKAKPTACERFLFDRRRRAARKRPTLGVNRELRDALTAIVRERRHGWASVAAMLDDPRCPLKLWALKLRHTIEADRIAAAECATAGNPSCHPSKS